MGVRPLIRRTRAVFRRMSADETESDHEQEHEHENDSGKGIRSEIPLRNSAASREQIPSSNQRGVQDVEAVTLTWSKHALIALFINIWFLYFVSAFQLSISSSLNPYVTSSFSAHSLSAVPTALADAFAAATYMPMAKLMDVWGRAEGFLFMVVFLTVGLVLMAACNTFEAYCAANVFYYVGFYGMEYAVDVVTADASTLRNRAFAYAFTSSPYIITAFAGPKVADRFYNEVSWRWGFGAWAIATPIVALPLYGMLKWNLHKAQREGYRVKRPSGRTRIESVKHWGVEFDLLGVFIFTAGLVLFLLPFDIADYAPRGWATGYIIAMLVIGVSMLFLFALWEKFLAPSPLFEWRLLTNRTIIGAVLLDATYQLSNYCWSYYLTSWLQVNNDLTLETANYINNIFDVVSGVILLLTGWAIRQTGKYKWTLYISIPLYILAQGLMIHFRQPNMSVGYQVMCQIFLAIAGSVFILVEQLAILAAVDHQHIATALALLNVVGTIGNSAGLTISTSVWQHTYLKALRRALPENVASDEGLVRKIYDDLVTQTSYPVGSTIRTAIQTAYAYAELRLLAVGCGIMVLAIPWCVLIRDIDLKRKVQVKGTVL